jgi:hypothetical protein
MTEFISFATAPLMTPILRKDKQIFYRQTFLQYVPHVDFITLEVFHAVWMKNGEIAFSMSIRLNVLRDLYSK